MFYKTDFNYSNRKNRFEVSAYDPHSDTYYVRKSSWAPDKDSYPVQGEEFRKRYASFTNS